MIKVVIVEDEFLARQYLRDIIDWEKYGFCIVAEATNGREGIEMIHKFHPDLVITDVKMPKMDGLQMAQEVIKKYEDMKFILLTAYDEFNYARNALKLGIRSYILKHEIDSGILLAELEKMKESIIHETGKKQLVSAQILKKIVREPLQRMELESLITIYHLPVKRNKTVMLLAAFDSHANDTSEQHSTAETGDDKFLEIVNKVLGQRIEGDVFKFDENRYLVLINPPDINSKARMMEYTHKFCLDIQSQVEQNMKNTVSIAIGGVIEELCRIQKYYSQLMQLITLKFFTRGSAILVYDETVTSQKDANKELEFLLQKFIEYMMLDEFCKSKEYLYSIFIDILAKKKDMDLFRGTLGSVLDILHSSYIKAGNGLLEKYRKINVLYEDAGRFNNIYKVYDWVAGIIDSIIQARNSNYSRSVSEALKFISQNYNRDITLEKLAAVMGVSEIYACQLFKKEVGEAFKAYLIGFRVKKAKELLESGKYKIYEISEMVGYQTVQYFCQTFKRLTGKNPGDYLL